MAILTRPLFHSQERIDLEDLVQLQSGLRTDARLWTRQVLVDKNFILKGFDVSGIGTNQIAVNLLDATLLFAGRRDLTGVATIVVDGSSALGDTITIANSDGSSFTITAIAMTGTNSSTQYAVNTDQDIQAANIAASINLIGSGLAAATVGRNITVTASRTGYQNITASNSSNFDNNGSIIGTFDYAASTIESPSDLSYFILQSGATGVDTSITREISASERALTGIASKTLYVYGKLVTGQGTPITKAFWDPSANSGAGAEFNQRVDTASDLEMQLNITESELDQVTDAAATEFFANVAICQIEVDSSGIILAVRDTRPLFFEAQDDRPWARANAYASMTLPSTITNVSINVMIPAGIIPVIIDGVVTRPAKTVTGSEGGPFTLDETVSFWPIIGAPSEALTSAQVQSLSGTTTDFNKLDLSTVPSRQRIAIGQTSGTIRIVDEVRSNFFRDDKALGDFRNGLSALATEINNMKGTENWYDDPPASAKDLLRFINSTIVGLDPNARYSWEASGTDDGTLSLQLDPLSEADLTVLSSNTFVANSSTILFRLGSTTVHTLTARTSDPGVKAFGGLNFGFSSGTTLAASVTITVTFTQTRTDGTTFSISVPLTSGLSATGVIDACVTALNGDTDFAGSYIASRTSAELVVTALVNGTFFNAEWGTLPSGSNITTSVNRNIADGVNGIGAENFLVGTDSEATASHITSSINFISGLSASFQESATTSGDYRITIGRSDLTVDNFRSNAAGISPTNTDVMFPASANTTMLANLRLYGISNTFTFPASTYTVGANEVVFITLPDLDASSISNVNFNGTPFRYSQSGPTVSGTAWNATNRDIFQGSNNIVKTVPIADFESNERNYWIAYRDNAETIYIRDVGELGTGESANIGHGISNATLSYIGAPSENVSTPAYPQVDTINSFPPTGTEGAYLTTDGANDFNKTLVAQSENLTSAINDLNDHLTSIKDTQYQNLGLKLIRGGFWNWTIPSGATNGNLTSTLESNIQVPGIADSVNKIAALATPADTTAVNSLADGDILFVNLNRQSTSTPATALIVSKGNIDTGFTPTRDRIVIARRVGTELYIGINGTIKLASGQAAPLDSALQFLGIDANSQLPRQLATAPSNVNGNATTLDISTSDIRLQVRGNFTPGVADDTFVDLSLPIDGQILFWNGATFNFETGAITDEDTTNPFLGRGTSAPSFTPETPEAGKEVYYAIAIDAGVPITDTTGVDILPATLRDLNIGRVVGEPKVVVGTKGNASGSGRAEPPVFEGAIPVALVRVTFSGSPATVDEIRMSNVTVLGSAGGGGGGGTGNAVQDINNYLNRLNGSTFGYFSALVPAVSTVDFVDTNSTAGISSDGISLITGATLLTTNLIDPEFIEDRLIPERVEIEAIWGQTTEFPITTQIDPNAKWFISLNADDEISGGTLGTDQFTPVTFASTKNVVGVITSAGLLVGTNLTNAPVFPSPNAQVDTFFVENHDFSTGHKISLMTAGGLTLTAPMSMTPADSSTPLYVHSIDADSFILYTTVANADLGGSTGRIEITASAISTPVFTREEGIIPRIGHTNTSRAVFDQRNLTTDVGAFNRRRGGAYSTTSNPTVRLFVTGDANAAVGSPNAVMTSTALFYADQLGIEGVNPNGLDDLNNILRSSHLVNTVTATAGYGAPGRGVVLLDTAGANKELSISSNDKLRIDGTELSTGHIIENSAGTDLAERANLQFIGATIADDSANDRTVVTVDSFRRLTQTGGINSAGDGASAASQSSFHWIAPTGVSSIKVWLTSAGGTGGVGPNPTARPGGGAGGGTIITTLQVVAGQRYELLIADTNPGISDAGGSGRGGRNGGATVFRSPSGSTTALIDGKNRELLVSGGSGGGRSGAGAASDGGRFSSGTNTGAIDTTSTAVNFQVEVNAIGGKGAASGVSPGNNPQGGGSFYETGGPLRQHDGNERGSGGAGFLGFPGGEAMGGSALGGRGGIFLEYTGPASTIATGLTP